MNKPILYYVYDPMCSWCWGYRDSWLKLADALENKVFIRYQLGGLAPDSNVEMPISLQHTLRGIWHQINAQLGTSFNFDFWDICSPRRSTYPASRACLIARNNDKEGEMLFAIQEAYYLQAKNPSLNDTLVDLAENIGFDKLTFEMQLRDDILNEALLKEISDSRKLPIQGFPSLVLALGERVIPIEINYLNWQVTYSEITKLVDRKYIEDC